MTLEYTLHRQTASCFTIITDADYSQTCFSVAYRSWWT